MRRILSGIVEADKNNYPLSMETFIIGSLRNHTASDDIEKRKQVAIEQPAFSWYGYRSVYRELSTNVVNSCSFTRLKAIALTGDGPHFTELLTGHTSIQGRI